MPHTDESNPLGSAACNWVVVWPVEPALQDWPEVPLSQYKLETLPPALIPSSPPILLYMPVTVPVE